MSPAARCGTRWRAGGWPEERVGSYRKLERELEYIAGKQDESLRIAGKNRWKAIAKQHRQREKARAKYGRECSRRAVLTQARERLLNW